MFNHKKIFINDETAQIAQKNSIKFTHSPSPYNKNIKHTINWNANLVYVFKKDFYNLIEGIIAHKKINTKLINKYVRYFIPSRDRSILIVLKTCAYITVPNYKYSIKVLKIKGAGHYDLAQAALITPEYTDYLGPGFSRYEFKWDRAGNFNALKRTPWFKYGLRESSAFNEYNILNNLISFGIDVPFPLAYGSYPAWQKDASSGGFIITGYDSAYTDLIRLNDLLLDNFSKSAEGDDLANNILMEKIYTKISSLGGILKNIHKKEVIHFQPHLGNISILDRTMFLDWESAQNMAGYSEIQKLIYKIYDLNAVVLNLYKMALRFKSQEFFLRATKGFLAGYFPELVKIEIETISQHIVDDYLNKFDLKKAIFDSESLAAIFLFNNNKEIYNAVSPFFSLLITAEHILFKVLAVNKNNGHIAYKDVYNKILNSAIDFIEQCPPKLQSILKYIYSKSFSGLNL